MHSDNYVKMCISLWIKRHLLTFLIKRYINQIFLIYGRVYIRFCARGKGIKFYVFGALHSDVLSDFHLDFSSVFSNFPSNS